jgi:hypothetical protein
MSQTSRKLCGLEIAAKLATVLEVEPAELLLRVPLAPRSTSPIVSWVDLRPMVGALAVIGRGRDELTQLGERSDASELMFIILRRDHSPAPIFRGLRSGPDWVLSNLDFVTECGVKSRVCYLELHIVTPISGSAERLRLKGGRG